MVSIIVGASFFWRWIWDFLPLPYGLQRKRAPYEISEKQGLTNGLKVSTKNSLSRVEKAFPESWALQGMRSD